jgi:CheY-like chemotaxis protein
MNRKNILIVDDEQDVLLVLEKGLTAEGYSVITASSGNDAISLAKSRHPDLIILDVLMPDMEGPEVKRKLKEDPETKDIPLIFLTGMFPKREDDQDGRIVAGYVLFEKPYDILKLVFAIEQLLREKVSS